MKNKAQSIVPALLSVAAVSQFAVATEKANIIWIFSDDHSYQTIGAYGGRLQKLNMTPNIDRLAREGMRFDRCYVSNSICGPSRAVLLTGKHSHLNGKLDNRAGAGFNHNQMNFAGILRKNGYQTAMIGKIHLDGKMRGFDHWDVLPGQGAYNNPDFLSVRGRAKNTGYVTDIITDKTLDWLKNKRDKGKPFMLMMHHKAPHRTWIPARRHMSKYAGIRIPEPPTLFDDYRGRGTPAHGQNMTIGKTMRMAYDLKIKEKHNPQFAERNAYFKKHQPTGRELVRWKYQLYMKDYLRCVWAVDESVGRLLGYLKETGLDKNTIVMYCSDQGFYMGEHGWFDKRFMYEESYRTPLIVRWPGQVKPGSVNDDLVQNIDFAETFLAMAGVKAPEEMQGESIVPLMRGKTPDDWRKSLYYHYYEFPGPHSVKKHEGVSEKRYKLIRFYGRGVPGGEEWEFYDLEKDPREMKSEYGNPRYGEEIKRLKKELRRLRLYYKLPTEV